jgi:hypothetical protein
MFTGFKLWQWYIVVKLMLHSYRWHVSPNVGTVAHITQQKLRLY